MTRVVVLADTHIRRGSSRRLPDDVYALASEADEIWHAGDVVIPEVLDELAGFAPVRAVLGNNDRELFGVLPETVEERIDGVRIAMIHDGGERRGRPARLRRRFPDADLVLYGHSHQPEHLPGDDAAPALCNPGSPTERRRAPTHTVATVDVDDGEFAVRLVEVS